MTRGVEVKRARLHLRVNLDRCDLCGLCVSLCPAHSIVLAERSLVILEDKCLYCMACVLLCPRNALESEMLFETELCLPWESEKAKAP